MDMLTKLEELVLIAVLKLKDRAYGITIYEYVVQKTGNKVAVSSVYFPLERLVRKGYLESFKGDPTPKRGGMRKKVLRVDPGGCQRPPGEQRTEQNHLDRCGQCCRQRS